MHRINRMQEEPVDIDVAGGTAPEFTPAFATGTLDETNTIAIGMPSSMPSCVRVPLQIPLVGRQNRLIHVPNLNFKSHQAVGLH